MTNFRKGSKGFSLLELIVVVVVLGIISGLAVPAFDAVKQKSINSVAENNARGIVSDAKALAAFDNASLNDTYVDQAGAESTGYDATTNTVTVTSGGRTGVATINPTTGEITVAEVSTGGGSSFGTATTVAAGTYAGISIEKTGTAEIARAGGYMSRAIPVSFTLATGVEIGYAQGMVRVQPVIFDAQGNELTNTSWIYNTGYLDQVANGSTYEPAVTAPAGATYFARFLDYTNPAQASWYTATTDVFAGATIAMRVTDSYTNALLGYTNRVSVNWG